MTTAANPLYAFRAPRGLRRPDIDGDHFAIDRASVVNEIGALNIYPGAFRYKPDPTLELEFAIWEDSPDPRSKANYFNLTVREHYNVCMADDWEILEDATAMVWLRDSAGRLSFGRNDGRLGEISMTLMWRTAEAADEAQAQRSKAAREVSKSPEELQAEMQSKLGQIGASVEVLDEEDDGSDEVRTPKLRKRR